MKMKKGSKGFMAIKLDLEKVYDHLDLKFLENTLLGIGFHQHFVNIIMTCVMISSMQVVWNGELTKKFYPSWDI